MDMDEALALFVVESRELLEDMEAALLDIEQTPDDEDKINALFRAAHTIKGSAGLFGLDYVVRFTHSAENVLDKVRHKELRIHAGLVALLLRVCDHMQLLIQCVEKGDAPSTELLQQGENLSAELHQCHDIPALERLSEPSGVGSDDWHISLRFNADTLKNGMDPLSFMRYLNTIGQIKSIITLTEQLPDAQNMDPESCYLGFEIRYQSTRSKNDIEDVFEFVRDDALIHILPPKSKISEYVALINRLPEQDMLLGDILVRCGSLTASELKQALASQQQGENQDQPIGQVLVEKQMVHPDVAQAALVKQKQIRENQGANTIRVDAQRLDEHINLIGELIIAGASISLAAHKHQDSQLKQAAQVLKRLVEEVRDSALALRMVPIGATFNKFQRVVRDMSKELGKDIELEISGAETELDKTVIEKIGDPLTHLVRNSMDHGIEHAQERLAKGKPAQGTVRLNAYHDSGSIVIEVSDDGGGLNKEKILAKALNSGLINSEQTLSEQEIFALIFEPGFSTKEVVNDLSGRGVGMDVVRRNISALRGNIEIKSTENQGSTFRIRLPLTLAIIDGFLVKVGSSPFIVPLEMVVECVELSAADLDAAHGRNQLNLRGEVLPFIRLRNLFAIHEEQKTESLSRDLSEDLAFLLKPTKRHNIVVVHYAGMRAGLLVDDLLGEHQTVIRSLDAVFEGLKGASGFTILGSGQVALILDVPGLIQRATTSELNQAHMKTHTTEQNGH